jgi:hypothetical protein
VLRIIKALRSREFILIIIVEMALLGCGYNESGYSGPVVNKGERETSLPSVGGKHSAGGTSSVTHSGAATSLASNGGIATGSSGGSQAGGAFSSTETGRASGGSGG